MKKIWQKSLASMVSAALCLTAFVGCLTVNAADYQGSITSAGASVTTEDTQATVTLTLTSPAAMNVAAIAATSTYGTLVSVTENEEGYYIDDNKLLSEGKFFVDANDNEAGFTTANVALTFEKGAEVAVGTYPVTITYFAGESAATWAEETVELVVDGEIDIKVAAAVTEPVLDENITCTLSAGLGDTAYMSFRFNTAELTSYDSYELVVTRNTNDNDYNFKQLVTTMKGSDFTEYNSYVYAYYYGIELYSLTVPVSAVLNCKDAEGNVVAYSNTFESTLKDVLVANYNKSSNVNLKTTITDLLNAGAEAQIFFTSSRPSSDYAGLALPNDGFSQEYATAELGELATYNTANNGEVTIAAGAAVGASPYLSFNMAGISAEDISNYSLKVSYYDVVTKQTVTDTINGVDMIVGGSKYYAYFYNMAIYATNAEVKAELYDGVSVDPVSSYSYCFDSFISLRQSHATLGPVVVALGKLGQSFRTLKGV